MKLAGCIIKDSDNKILLIHRYDPKRTQWEIPGGRVELGEKPEQTAARELKEELGVEVKLLRIIGKKVFQEDGRSHEYDWFEAKIISGKLQLMEVELFDELRYFSVEEMQDSYKELSANTKNFVAAVVAGEVLL